MAATNNEKLRKIISQLVHHADQLSDGVNGIVEEKEKSDRSGIAWANVVDGDMDVVWGDSSYKHVDQNAVAVLFNSLNALTATQEWANFIDSLDTIRQ